MSRLRASVLATAAAALAVAGPAAAEPAQKVEAGWWWRLQPGLALPASPTGDGLFIQGAPDGPVAVAAVRATLAAGATNPVLTLRVSPGFERAGDGAVIVACPAASAWKPVRAGAWDQRPKADCAISATGIRAADGSAFTFDLAGFPTPADRLDVVLAPGRVAGPEGANGSVFAVELAPPEPADVSATPAVASDAEAAPGPAPAVDDQVPQTAASGDDFVPELARIPDAGTLDLGPAPLPAPSAPEGRRGPASARRPGTEQAAGLAATGRSPAARVWALAVLAVGLAALAWAATRPVPAPRRLVTLAGRPEREPPAAPEPVTGGLGRFRRERDRPPPRLV